MSRQCELTGKKPMVGNNVSHSHRKTRRRFLPNLCNVTLNSEAMGQSYKMRVAASALRSVDKAGGLDEFLAAAKEDQLSDKARRLKRDLAKKQTAA